MLTLSTKLCFITENKIIVMLQANGKILFKANT